MDVSIIIVNYNTKELIANCIQSIYEKTNGIDYEIIVVDNASVDGSQQMIAEKFPDVKLIELNENIGFGRANNKAIEFAIGRNILFLNSDTKLINNAIMVLADYLDNSPNSGACGANLFNENLEPAHSYRLIFPSIALEVNDLLLRTPEKVLFGRNTEHNYSNINKSVAYITGADLMIKKSVIERIGCFSPSYFMYYEETDLCYRIYKTGLKIYSVPEAKIQHLEGKSFGDKKENQQRINLSENSRIIFYSKNYSKIYCKIANCIYLFRIKLRISLKRILNKESDQYWESILNGYKSTKII